jgi:IclR helix-turn-helix domain
LALGLTGRLRAEALAQTEQDVIERSAATPTETAVPEGAVASAEELIEARLWRALGDDFARIGEVEPPARFPHARERMLMCRLYLGLIRTVGEDFGAPFTADGDSPSFRAIGIYLLCRTMLCAPAHAGDVAHALKLPRATVLHSLQQLIKHGYVERIGNAYRVTEKVNIPDLAERMQVRIEMIATTARKLAELRTSTGGEAEPPLPGEP